ncbi:hypothetical protein C8R45DRAFT_1073146 [Mycena sanguinolenta]|nr:hypothetical protein C8R45DRAFT_1073146 [Mycena sanguinolenta]
MRRSQLMKLRHHASSIRRRVGVLYAVSHLTKFSHDYICSWNSMFNDKVWDIHSFQNTAMVLLADVDLEEDLADGIKAVSGACLRERWPTVTLTSAKFVAAGVPRSAGVSWQTATSEPVATVPRTHVIPDVLLAYDKFGLVDVKFIRPSKERGEQTTVDSEQGRRSGHQEVLSGPVACRPSGDVNKSYKENNIFSERI